MNDPLYRLKVLAYHARMAVYRAQVWRWDSTVELWYEDAFGADALRALPPDVANASRLIAGTDGPKRRHDGIARLEAIYAERGDAEAAARIAFCHLIELGDPYLALKWYIKALDAGALWAGYPIGVILQRNRFTPHTRRLAGVQGDHAAYFRQAAGDGHWVAACRFAEVRREQGEIGRLACWAQKLGFGFRYLGQSLRGRRVDWRMRMR